MTAYVYIKSTRNLFDKLRVLYLLDKKALTGAFSDQVLPWRLLAKTRVQVEL